MNLTVLSCLTVRGVRQSVQELFKYLAAHYKVHSDRSAPGNLFTNDDNQEGKLQRKGIFKSGRAVEKRPGTFSLQGKHRPL